MSSKNQRNWKSVIVFAFGMVLAAGGLQAADPCVQPDNGTGTVTLPPAGCQYLSPDQVHMIIDGLPPGTTIVLEPIHQDFLCKRQGSCGEPGGKLDGEVESFSSKITFRMKGTGALAGYSRTLSVPVSCETHTGPRQRGAAVQKFKTDMYRMEGIVTGDQDFDLLKITAGTANGLPSPGETVLTRQGYRRKGNFEVKSWFKVNYAIEFKGNPAGKLGKFAGTTKGTALMEASGRR
jgi:hypothetical protein